MREYKSFLKTVGGNEGTLCHYPTRLDTYGCGCQHDCDYCYAKSLLDFRGLWDPADPAVADPKKIERVISKMKPGTVVRLGGMTDCFQPIERQHGITRRTIEMLNAKRVEYLIVTKSAMVAEYMDILDNGLAHIQITITTLDDDLARTYEKADPPSERVKALLKLQAAGYDVAARLSPLIEPYMDFDRLNGLGIQKAVAEFLRANTWVKRWFDIDYSPYIVKSGGYSHLPLSEKERILSRIKIPEVTVCEDVPEHYEYWKRVINPNPEDCCNLRR